MTEKIIELSIQASEARTDTKFAQLIGKIDLLGEKMNGIGKDVGELKDAVGTLETKTNNTRVIVITTILGAFIGMAGIVYTIAAFGVSIAQFVKG